MRSAILPMATPRDSIGIPVRSCTAANDCTSGVVSTPPKSETIAVALTEA